MDRLTDESNTWLRAVRMEEAGKLQDACILFLQDASVTLKSGDLTRTALSCSCAANCLRNTDESRTKLLYEEAGEIYEENAVAIMSKSIRGTIWSFEEAYKSFLLAHNKGRARQAYRYLVSLTRSVDPFIERETPPEQQIADDQTVVKNDSNLRVYVNPELIRTLDEFLAIRRSCKEKEIQVSEETWKRETNTRKHFS